MGEILPRYNLEKQTTNRADTYQILALPYTHLFSSFGYGYEYGYCLGIEFNIDIYIWQNWIWLNTDIKQLKSVMTKGSGEWALFLILISIPPRKYSLMHYGILNQYFSIHHHTCSGVSGWYSNVVRIFVRIYGMVLAKFVPVPFLYKMNTYIHMYMNSKSIMDQIICILLHPYTHTHREREKWREVRDHLHPISHTHVRIHTDREKWQKHFWFPYNRQDRWETLPFSWCITLRKHREMG